MAHAGLGQPTPWQLGQQFTKPDVPTPDLTVKATGKPWYWSHAYPGHGNFEFDSRIVQDKDFRLSRRSEAGWPSRTRQQIGR